VTDLVVQRGDGVLVLTLSRPDHLNALSDELADSLADELERAASSDVRVVVLRGAGRAFCSGADISAVDGPMQLDVRALDRANRIVRAVVRLDAPVVSAVHGVAAGVGCSIALASDLVVAAESASFVLSFARIGLMPDGGSSVSLAASVGRARAMRMALLGEPLTAREAYDAGLVSHLADDEAFETVVDELVARLASGPPLSHSATKRAVNAATLGGLEDALERERTGQTILLRTRDAAAGMRAVTERRPADFVGE
jgi:enoyl-CoA hydratase